MPSLLHHVREALRRWVCTQTAAPLQRQNGDKIHPKAFLVSPGLSLTQKNFLATLQANGHRATKEKRCPLCGEDGGLEHALWSCEARMIDTVRREPRDAHLWPENFRRLALYTTSESMDESRSLPARTSSLVSSSKGARYRGSWRRASARPKEEECSRTPT
eukprot:3755417-Amphidinium_carterae.1